jgi:hypothetical protein
VFSLHAYSQHIDPLCPPFILFYVLSFQVSLLAIMDAEYEGVARDVKAMLA